MSDRIYDAFAVDDAEADRRAEEWRHRDPFKQIAPALLSAEHIEAYVRQTGMLHPIDLNREDTLKGASCEILPGRRSIRWQDGEKIEASLDAAGELVLPPNSIVFVQIASRIRLPDYIAIRFNLRIKHVHRGLLLGTGPLVDPTFKGDLLIPLHNLTASEYRISANEGLIWVEFTKTSRRTDGDVELGPIPPSQRIAKPSSRDMPSLEFYFEKANRNRPIESSIPGEVRAARKRADKALSAAKSAKRTNQVYAGIGFLTVLGAAVGLASFLQGANTRVDALSARFDALVKADVESNAAISMLRSELERVRSDLAREHGAEAARDASDSRGLAYWRARLDRLEMRIRDMEGAKQMPR